MMSEGHDIFISWSKKRGKAAALALRQWLPDVLRVEQWFSPDTVKLLRQMGHNIEFGVTGAGIWEPYWSDGECVAIDQTSGDRLGASDDRNNGKAIGY